MTRLDRQKWHLPRTELRLASATRLALILLAGVGLPIQPAAANPPPPYPQEKVEVRKLLNYLRAEMTARPDDPVATFRYVRMRFHYLVKRNDRLSVRKLPDPDAMFRVAADVHETVYDFTDIAERSLNPNIAVEELNEVIRLSEQGLRTLENPEVRLISGWCRMRIGNRDEAVLHLRKAFYNSSGDFLAKYRGAPRDSVHHHPRDERIKAAARYAGKWLQELLDQKEDGAELRLIQDLISEMMKYNPPVY